MKQGPAEMRCVWQHDKRIEEFRMSTQEERCHQIPPRRISCVMKQQALSQRVKWVDSWRHWYAWSAATPRELKWRAVHQRQVSFILALPRGDFVSIYRRVSKYRH